jgi:hypothetical protein
MDVPEPDSEDGLDESTPEREAEPADDEPEAGEHIEPTAEEAPAGSGSAAADAPDASIGEDSGAESAEDETTGDDETASGEQEAPENLEETVMETMRELNEGDGVEREVLLAAVVDDYDVTPADVEDALESALMGGRCYESGEDTLKPI